MAGLRLLDPRGLWLLAGLAPLVLLYVLKTRRRTQRVASVWLWTASQRDLVARHPWRRLVPEVPLLLEVLALSALAIALARPSTGAADVVGEHVAIVVDESASMQTRGASGETRMALARAAVRGVVDRLRSGSDALVIAARREPLIASTPERDRARLDAVAEALEAVDEEVELAPSIALAVERLRALGGSARVVVVTDGATSDSGPLATAGIPVEVVQVGEPADSAAFVRLDVRSAIDPVTHEEQTQVFAQVRSFAARPLPVRVAATLEGERDVIASRSFTLAPGEKLPVVLAFDPPEAARGRGLEVRISPGDAAAFDDVAYARVPPPVKMPVVVATDAPASWTARALAADPQVDLRRLSVAQLESVDVEPGALVVVEGACPAAVPGGDVLVIGPPRGPCFLARVGEDVGAPQVTSWSPDDPRLRFVALDGLFVARARRLEGAASPLVRSADSALVADASPPSRTVTIVGFEVAQSNWPLEASFVLFVRNVVELARAHRLDGVAAAVRAGDAPRVRVPGGTREATLTRPSGETSKLPLLEDTAALPRLDKAGLYRVAWTSPHVGEVLVPVNLLSERESDVGPRPLDLSASGSPPATGPRAASPDSSPWRAGLALLAALLVVVDLSWVTRGAARRRRSTLLATIPAAAIASYAALSSLQLVPETHLRFRHPSWLWLGAAVALLACHGVGRLSLRASGWRRALLSTAAMVAVTCGALAPCEPELGLALDRLAVVVAVDRSRSMDRVPDLDATLSRELDLAARSMRSGDQWGRVVFGATAALEGPLRLAGEPAPGQRVEVGRDATDLEAGLRQALLELPAGSAGRVVMVTDGVATRGDLSSAARAAVAEGVPVDVVALDHPPVADVRVVDVRAPTGANVGEPVTLRVATASTAPAEIEVRVREGDGPERAMRVQVRAGEDVVSIREVARAPGLQRFDVSVSAIDPGADADPDDNAGTAFVRVHGESRALVVEGDTGSVAPMVEALRGAGIEVEAGDASVLPGDVGGLAAFDLVVMSDVRASDLASTQLEALAAYARDVGGGLLLMGGDRSMGPGGYARTSVEEVSPVSFDLRQDRRRAALAEVIAIDYSGSMGAAVGGHTKLALANEAAARSAALLGPGDRIAVEHVDTEVRWTVPIRPADDPRAIAEAIRRVGVGGGGIYTDLALRAAYEALAGERTNLRHLLLFADGSDAEQIAGCRALVRGAADRAITTSVISLGRGGDSPELEALSKIGGGRFYLIEDATRLPEVFSQETILATRSALHEEPFRPAPGEASGVTRGVDVSAAPDLGGYVVTLPKPRASVLLSGPEGDPILASWSVGLGRAAAFTSDYKGRWGRAWVGWRGAARLFGQLGRALARRGDDARVRLSAGVSSTGELRVTADALDDDGRAQTFRRLTTTVAGPDGFRREVPLEAVAAGHYAATVPLARPGTYVATTRDDTAGEVVGTTAAAMTSGDELRPLGSDHAALERLALETGGRVRTSLDRLFDDRGLRRYGYHSLVGWLLAVAGAALLVAVSARKVGVPEVLAAALGRLASRRQERARAVARSEEARRRAEVDLLRDQERLRAARAAGRGGEPRPASPAAPPAVAFVAPATPAPDTAATASPTERPLTTAERLAARRRQRR